MNVTTHPVFLHLSAVLFVFVATFGLSVPALLSKTDDKPEASFSHETVIWQQDEQDGGLQPDRRTEPDKIPNDESADETSKLIKQLSELKDAAQASSDRVEQNEIRLRGLAIFRQLDAAGFALENADVKLRPLIAETIFHGASSLLLSDTLSPEDPAQETMPDPVDLLDSAIEWGFPNFELPLDGFNQEEKAKIRDSLETLEQKYKSAAEIAKKKSEFILATPKMQEFEKNRTLIPPNASVDPSPEFSAMLRMHKQLLLQKEKRRKAFEKLFVVVPSTENKFELASYLFAQPETESRGLVLMKRIAPPEKPGYAAAHLVLGRHYFDRSVKNFLKNTQARDFALTHLRHCLALDESMTEARSMRATLLADIGQHEQAREDFKILFAKDPSYGPQLVAQNVSLNLVAENPEILASAASEFKQRLEQAPGVEFANWQSDLANYVGVLQLQDEFQIADETLSAEEDRYLQEKKFFMSKPGFNPELSIRELRGKNLVAWAESFGFDTELDAKTARRQLDLLQKALELNRDAGRAMYLVARIATGSSDLAADAKQIYDIEAEDARSLLWTATAQMDGGDLYQAIFYYEMSMKKAPNESMTINNLAFAYLICDVPKPKLALKMVDRAMEIGNPNPTMLTYYHDTRARALMQLDRYPEAIEAFESALELRDDTPTILTGMIECCEKSDDPRADEYRQRLKQIEFKKIGG